MPSFSNNSASASVRTVPTAVAAAVAAAAEEVRSQDEETGAGVEVAVVAVRHRFGMDGGNARAIAIVVHAFDARPLGDAQNLFVRGLAALGLRNAGLPHRDHPDR